MNKAAIQFWESYWGEQEKPSNVDAFCFGDTPDELAAKVVAGEKTATCNLLMLYELHHRQLPAVGDYSIVLNSALEPVALIQLEKVALVPYDEIDEAFALAEGDGSYSNWDAIHTRYFTEALAAFNQTFHRQLLVVCQFFSVRAVNM